MTRTAVVISVVHTPLDARIHHREIRALLEAGWDVRQVAPWRDSGVAPREGTSVAEGTTGTFAAEDVPRAVGRRRLRALWWARGAIRRVASDADVILLHDPELLFAAAGLLDRGTPPVFVWDVHEDTARSLTDKPWLPAGLRPLARLLVRAMERWAERRFRLVLAEDAYRQRFARDHPVVPNHPAVPENVPEPGDDRVVYLGRLSRGRGLDTILAAARLLDGEVTVHLMGPADEGVRAHLDAAVRDGIVRWDGFVPNDVALTRVEGATAGLSLLRDEPNYRASLPTKVVEYLARGVPPITTPLPVAADIVRRHDCGIVVPFDDAAAVADAVRALVGDPERRHDLARRGREAARAEFDWSRDANRFVALLDAWVDERESPPVSAAP